MKKTTALFWLLLLANHLLMCQTWIQLTDFPAAGRDDGVSVISGNKAYFGTGNRELGQGLGTDFYSFDLTSGTWSTIASMPGNGRQYAVAFSAPNYFFVYGGWGDGNFFFNDLYRYDISANTWSLMATKPGTAVMAACSFTLGDKAYVVCGRYGNDNEVSNQVWEYNMTSNAWMQKNNFPVGVWRGSAATFSGSGYVMLGKDANLAYRKEVYKYDQGADSWTKIADFPGVNTRYYSALQGLDTKMVLFGGIDTNDVFYKETWFFDGQSSFTQGPDLPSFARRGGMSVASGNSFYYSSGLSASGRTKETWRLNVPVGISEWHADNGINIYPNPVIDELNVLNTKRQNCNISILNITGELLLERKVDSEESFIIDLSHLKAGVYFVKITSSAGLVSHQKMIKQ